MGITKINYYGEEGGKERGRRGHHCGRNSWELCGTSRSLSRVLIVGTPARFGAGTPPLWKLRLQSAAIPRNSPAAHGCVVCVGVKKKLLLRSSEIAHNRIIRALSIYLPFARAARLCSRAVVRDLDDVMLFRLDSSRACSRNPREVSRNILRKTRVVNERERERIRGVEYF